MEHHFPYLNEIMIFLTATAIGVPLFHRFKINPILGYLLLGVLVGPNGLGQLSSHWPALQSIVLQDTTGIKALAELGVIMLLFMIGLELSFTRLWAMKRMVFGFGGLQIVLTGSVLMAILYWLFNLSIEQSLIIGSALALSSTAIIMKMMMDKGHFTTRKGQANFSVLLMQDIAVVPILILVASFASTSDGSEGWTLATLGAATAEGAVAIGLIVFIGYFVLRPLFRLVTATHNRGVFLASILLVVMATALITGYVGLSLALGAFLGGVSLAETEYQHQIEVDLEPVKDLLLGLLFMSVGMRFNPEVLISQADLVIGGMLALIIIKTMMIAAIGMLFKLPFPLALGIGLTLAQGGEFAFVVMELATGSDIIPESVAYKVNMIAALSMFATPLLYSLGNMISSKLYTTTQRDQNARVKSYAQDLREHVIIAGFGRVGQTVGHVLEKNLVPYVAIDRDSQGLSDLREKKKPIFFGDASRIEILKKSGIDRAKAIIIAVDQAGLSKNLVKTIRKKYPDLPIFARAISPRHATELQKLGVTESILEAVEMSLQISHRLLSSLEVPEDMINKQIETLRFELSRDGDT